MSEIKVEKRKLYVVAQDNIDRHLACVEACKNIPTPALEAGVVEKMKKYFGNEYRCECSDISMSKHTEMKYENMRLKEEIIKLLEEMK